MNLFDYIEKYSIIDAKKIAIMDDKKGITYKQLYEYIHNNQRLLINKGYKSGDKIILKIYSQLDFVIAFLTLLSIECWVIPVPSDITYTELQKILDSTKAKFFSDEEFMQFIYCSDTYRKIPFNKPEPDKSGIYHLTSGTTGTPKFCIRTLDSLAIEGLSYKETFTIGAEDRILSISPLYHSYAMGAAIMASLVSGAFL